jgi:hypothetical protein
MDLINAIRTLRKEKDMTFEQAKECAVAFFVKKGWPLPVWAERYRPKEN